MHGDPADDDELPEGLSSALDVDLEDPEVARARSAIAARLLGVPEVPPRIGRFVVLERLGAGGMGIVYAAFDPQLDRKVAVKVLFRRGASAKGHAILMAEAKVMARLTHPNVVHVYEIGDHDGQVFVAMEYVHGQTLRSWWSERSRSVRDVLAVMLQAGEGLAALHAAGIVHRDFKPDNILVSGDPRGTRARVVDFGLARAVVEPTDPNDEASGASTSVHEPGTRSRMGTPGYMAPEQIRGEAPDHGADQFSFCVTLWEALVGAAPFVGSTLESMLDAVARGEIRDPPRLRMPAWVERVLRRGLADDSEAPHRGRYARLEELLRDLERDPAQLRRKRIAWLAALVGVVGAFAIGNAARTPVPLEDACGGGGRSIVEAWPAETRAQDLARIAERGGEYGRAIAPRLQHSAAAFEAGWAAGHGDACRAHQRGEQSAELLDRRMTCLHRARSAFAALGRITAGVEEEGLPDLVVAFDALPDPAACSDLEALKSFGERAPPEDLALVAGLAEASMFFAAGSVEQAIERSGAVLEEARAVGYRPRVAEALVQHGFMLIEGGRQREALDELREAIELALAVGDDALALRAWGSGAWLIAIDRRMVAHPIFSGRAVMTAIAERHVPSETAMAFFGRLGAIDNALSQRESSLAAHRRAVAISEQLEGVRAASLANLYAGLALSTDDMAECDRLLARSEELTTEAYGPEHPRALSARLIRAFNLVDVHEVLERAQPVCRDMQRMHPEDRAAIAECERDLALAANLVGDEALATAATDRWAAAGAEDVALAKGMAALRHGDAATAVELMRPVVQADERYRTDDAPFYVFMQFGRLELDFGRALRAAGDPGAAAMLARGLADVERAAHMRPRPALLRLVAYGQQLRNRQP